MWGHGHRYADGELRVSTRREDEGWLLPGVLSPDRKHQAACPHRDPGQERQMEKKGESRLRQAAEVGPRDGEDAGSPRVSLWHPAWTAAVAQGTSTCSWWPGKKGAVANPVPMGKKLRDRRREKGARWPSETQALGAVRTLRTLAWGDCSGGLRGWGPEVGHRHGSLRR